MTKTTKMESADETTPEVDALSPGGAKLQIKQEPTDEIKDYAETTMNEMLSWYGYEKVASDDRLQLMATFSEQPHLQTCHRGQDSESGSSIKMADSELAEKHRRLVRALNKGESETKKTENTDTTSSVNEDDPDGQPFVCCWCQVSCLKLFSPHTATNTKPFCSELCFTQCRRASFKKNKMCDWCRHVRHTVSYVDFYDGDQQLQFCGDKCLNQYKMNIFCHETQQHLAQIRDSVPEDTPQIIVTPDLWANPNMKRNQNSPLNLDTKMSANSMDTASEVTSMSTGGMVSPPSSCNSRPASASHDSDVSEFAEDAEAKRKVLVKKLFREERHKRRQLTPPRESLHTKTNRTSHVFSPSSTTRHSPRQSSSQRQSPHRHVPLHPNFCTRYPHDPKDLSLPPMLTQQLPPSTLMVPYPILIPVPIPVPIPIPIPFPFPSKSAQKEDASEVKPNANKSAPESTIPAEETLRHKETDAETKQSLALSTVKESVCSRILSTELEPARQSYPASHALHRISCACCQSDKCQQKTPTTKTEDVAYKGSTSPRFHKVQRKRRASRTEPQTDVIDLSKDKVEKSRKKCTEHNDSGENRRTSSAGATTPNPTSSSPIHLMAAPVSTAYSARRSRILDAPAVFKDSSDGSSSGAKNGITNSNSLASPRVSLYGKKSCIRTHIKSK